LQLINKQNVEPTQTIHILLKNKYIKHKTKQIN